METTLMELVDGAEVARDEYAKTDENLTRAAELESLGFVDIAQRIIKEVETKDRLARIAEFRYRKITVDAIKKFLKKKVELYDASRPKQKEKKLDGGSLLGYTQQEYVRLMSQYQGVYFDLPNALLRVPTIDPKRTPERFFERTQDFHSVEDGKIGQYLWVETPVENYLSIPPKEVLNDMRVHKARNLFDYFTIASVEHIKDPLLLGRIEGTTDRYFIVQWGADIHVEDVL